MLIPSDAEKAAGIAEVHRLLDNLISPDLIQKIIELIEANHECDVYANAWHTNLWLDGERIEAHDITVEAIGAAAAHFEERQRSVQQMLDQLPN